MLDKNLAIETENTIKFIYSLHNNKDITDIVFQVLYDTITHLRNEVDALEQTIIRMSYNSHNQ